MLASIKAKKPYLYLGHKELLGIIAKWAIQQSPYTYPENLDIVLQKVSNSVKEDLLLGELIVLHPDELWIWLDNLLMPIPEFRKWNESKKKKTPPYRDEYHTDPDYDFIDLDAFIRNVRRSILTSREDF